MTNATAAAHITGMTADTSVRQPKGVPVGGQFAATNHAEPSVALPAQVAPPVDEHFASLVTDELAENIDARLKGRISGKDWYSGSKVDQVFETEVDEDTLHVYTRDPGADEGVSYSVGVVDGKAQVSLNDDYNTGVKPVDLHPERWTGPDDAAKEISNVLLEMQDGFTEALADKETSPDGFASNTEYRRWKER